MEPSLQITVFVLYLHFLTKCFQLPFTGDILIPLLHAKDLEKLDTLLRMRSSARLTLLKTALRLLHCLPGVQHSASIQEGCRAFHGRMARM